MTCVIGYKDDFGIVMGADSIAVMDNQYFISPIDKIFMKGDFMFGYCGSPRMGDLLKYSLKFPKHKKGLPDHEYLATSFINEVITCFAEAGFQKVEAESIYGGLFIIGYHNNLYRIDADYQVNQTMDNYIVIGSGEPYSLGALAVVDKMELTTEEKIIIALEASESFCTDVKPPFKTLKNYTDKKIRETNSKGKPKKPKNK